MPTRNRKQVRISQERSQCPRTPAPAPAVSQNNDGNNRPRSNRIRTPNTASSRNNANATLQQTREKEAEKMAQTLLHATDVLLERLFAHLSQLPEEELQQEHTTGGSSPGGMTLPASALAWLSSQLMPPRVPKGRVPSTVWSTSSCRDRLRLLHFLLPRLTHLRISRQPWPTPPTNAANKTTRRRPRFQLPSVPSNTCPPQELNCSGISVSSGLTKDEFLYTPDRYMTDEEEAVPPAPPTRLDFWDFMQDLQHHPTIDLRLFPRLQVLVLESIPPTWISHLHSLRPTLQVLKWNRSCFYDYLPTLFLPDALRPSQQTSQAATNTPEPVHPIVSLRENSDSTFHSNNTTTIFATLTHLDLSHCGLGELSGISKTLARCAPHLQSVSLAHNDLVTQKSSLKPFRHASQLAKLNLSYNQITYLPQAYCYLGGQLKSLNLSHNRLVSTRGIDRLYALERLYLDHNCLSDLADVIGLSQMPQLKVLWLTGNPLEEDTTKYAWSLWSWFQHVRHPMTKDELPTIDGHSISAEEWTKLCNQLNPHGVHFVQNLAVSLDVNPSDEDGSQRRHNGIIFKALPIRHERVRRQGHVPRRKAKIQSLPSHMSNEQHDHDIPSLPTRRRSSRRQNEGGSTPEQVPMPAWSVADVLRNLQEDMHGTQEEKEQAVVQPLDPLQDKTDSVSNADNSPAAETTESEGTDVEEVEPPPDARDPRLVVDTSRQQSGAVGKMPPSEDVPPTTPTAIAPKQESKTEPSVVEETSGSRSVDAGSTSRFDGSATPLAGNSSKKVTTIRLYQSQHLVFDALQADWDEVVQQASEGLIPDGKPRMPVVPSISIPSDRKEGPFSSDITDLLSPLSTDERLQMPLNSNGKKCGSTTDDTSTTIGEGIGSNDQTSNLPEQIYPDDLSIPSSLGTNRDDFPGRSSKYQIAEQNAAYDGPERLKELRVLDNFELYFESYVFVSKEIPISTSENEEVNGEDYDDWQWVALRFPRIQLWPEDRPRMSSTLPTTQSPVLSARERFVRVWEEDVVPCGKPTLRRLTPNRRIRLGFHGDQLFSNTGNPDSYSECRKVYLCLSTTAFYVLLREDAVTQKYDEKGIKKRFPNPIPSDAVFGDAPWPHAAARHPLHELESITIGFEFQRLYLRFSNPMGKKMEPYIYVLITSNKTETVGLLQEFQRVANEAQQEDGCLESEATSITIHNDSQHVLDAVQVALTPEIVGTILHYQLVQQRWKHGEGRGTVRRACVVSDKHLLLLDEDYSADGHTPADGTPAGSNVPTTEISSYRVVQQASLDQVAEVQAAGADPTAITIVINPVSRLARTQRWRLVCRDGIGAERLVDAVRKAIAMESMG
eukprot:Nitzschia sp. Nitz4//scaffold60_size111251//4004//8026//NITZ4_004134-RA/size111251-processed-gene-0.15-mRNA-1//1//CDS//3329555525//2796//frame0